MLYVNDIGNVSTLLLPTLFADDTPVFLTGENIDQMIEIMNGELNNSFIWLNSNKLPHLLGWGPVAAQWQPFVAQFWREEPKLLEQV